MGTVSQLHERLRLPAHRIASDEEALEIAATLALDFARQASDRDINRILPYEELDALSQSGLLGITVPAEYGGLDISNAVLAEASAILATGDPSIAQVLQDHFHSLEALRSGGSETQKRVFYGRALIGDRFCNALSETETTRLVPDGLGYRLNGRKLNSAGVLFADWIAVSALDPDERSTLSFVARDTEGVQIIDDWDGFGQRTTGSGTAILHNLRISADALMPNGPSVERPATIGLVGRIVQAGIDLGIARAAFTATLDFVRNHTALPEGAARPTGDDPLTVTQLGQVAIRIEAAAAMVDRAGQKLDIAQINANETNIAEAALAVAAAKTLTAEIAIAASNALFELAGASSAKIGLNLDRHWRNARIHTINEPLRWQYHAVGNYHLNRIALPENGEP